MSTADPARRRTLMRIMIVSAIATVLCALLIDEPIARALEGSALADVGKQIIFVVDYVAMFWIDKWGSAIVLGGIAVIMAAVPRWRRHAPRMVVVVLIHIATRYLVTWLKVTTGRVRPASWLTSGGTAGQTFWQSGAGFPSGHVSLFASITYPIVALWPCRPWIAAVAYAAPLM
jgi:MFS superfamily sulfate permease-like transporter